MGQLTVLTTSELEPGYRLAGVAVRVCDSVEEATDNVNELMHKGEEGDIVAVHEPYFNELASPLRRRIDSVVTPLVIALPGGEGADVEAERRAQHLRILWEAIGYRITFDQGGDPA
jgi:vacuolar-type H+-ATPase subunit F/Vma7